MRVKLVGGFLALCLVGIGFSLFASRSTTVTGTNLRDAALIRRGQGVYTAQCAPCHGANLEGQPNWQTQLANGTYPAPPHDASGHTWHHSDEFLFETVRYGGQALAPAGAKNAMPAFAQLSDGDIWAVLTYIKSTWPADVLAQQGRAHE